MPRIKITLPQRFDFQTKLTIRIGDLNYGGHVGNDVFLSLVHEARVRFLQSLGYSEMEVEGVGIIMSDAALIYKAEAFYGMELSVRVAVTDFTRVGCDMIYHLLDDTNQREIARVKTGIVFYDYTNKKVAPVPKKFKEKCIP